MPVQLRKHNTAPLLRTVNNKPHAKPEDHHDYRPLSPPASIPSKTDAKEEDYDREPESSSDEAAVIPEKSHVNQRGDVAELGSSQHDGTNDRPASYSSPPTSEKRKIVHATEDNDDVLFAEFNRHTKPKRQKMDGPGVKNIHAPPESKHGRASAALKKAANYSRRNHAQAKSKKMVLQQPRVVKSVKSSPPKATFRMPKAIPVTKSSGPAGASFRTTRASSASKPLRSSDIDCASSSSLSSVPNSPGEEAFEDLQTQPVQPRSIEVECAICGADVPRVLQEDFEDAYNGGKKLNYKWQQRFCRHHKQHESREVWKERGYPEIDWANLGTRLKSRAYTKHLKKVLAGETASVYRDRLAEKLESGIMSLQQGAAEDGKTGADVGYYGPRGEKLLTEFIVAKFADEIRDRSIKDPLVAAAGVQGGVSGFVQAVLVPELAICLVQDDLGPDTSKTAAEVIAESSDLGELLNPEVEDVLHESEDEDE